MKLSKKMLKAGWHIIPEKNGAYTIFESNAQTYTFTPDTNQWSRYPWKKSNIFWTRIWSRLN